MKQISPFRLGKTIKPMFKGNLNSLININNVKRFNDARKAVTVNDDIKELIINGQKVFAKKLGGGGSKDVYEITLNRKKMAIALPNVNDNLHTIAAKWKENFKEVGNTEQLSKLGLLANDNMRIQIVSIKGNQFPAIQMTPFSEMPFKVIDMKKGNKPIFSDEIGMAVNEAKILSDFENIIKDIKTLVNNNIHIANYDSVGFAWKPGSKLRLYLSDLTKDNMTNTRHSKRSLAKYYVDPLVEYYMVQYSDKVNKTNPYIIKILDDFDAYDELVEKITSKVLS